MRQHHRLIFRSLFRARVYDTTTNELIGYIADISESGFRLRGDMHIEAGSRHLFKITLRQSESKNPTFTVNAECIWCRENTTTGHIETGFTLVEPNEEYQACIAQMVAKRIIKT
ncbi:MAG: PilZ domain-containing protein [Cellvibrio sp.]